MCEYCHDLYSDVLCVCPCAGCHELPYTEPVLIECDDCGHIFTREAGFK